jgi:hypothetical protein
MERRVFHGLISPTDVARALVAHFNRANLAAQQLGDGKNIIVQIASRQRPVSGGQTALSVQISEAEDGVIVQLGKQTWFGVAASLGVTALSLFRNPFSLIGRLDYLAQYIENLQLTEDVWGVIENVARMRGATFELSERLRRLVCEYCSTANPVGEPSCIACGAPLGKIQPFTCNNCGFVISKNESTCPNCGQKL